VIPHEQAVTDSNATKLKSFHCVTGAREIPLRVKLDLLQISSEQLQFVPTLSFPHTWSRKGKAAFPQQYFPDLRACVSAALL